MQKWAAYLLIILAVVIVSSIFFFGGVAVGLLKPVEFKAISVSVVAHGEYPAIKVVFETSKWPISFKLMTAEGEVVDTVSVSEPNRVVYLHPTKSYTNLGPSRYVIKAYYLDKEIWTYDLTIAGVKPDIHILGIKCEANDLEGLLLKEIIIKVLNAGDAPLYIAPPNIRVFFDNEKISYSTESEIVQPGENKEIRIKLYKDLGYLNLGRYDLSKEHILEIEIANVKASYTILKLMPEVKLIDRRYSLGLLDVTLEITNNWICPLPTKWPYIRVYVNNKEIPFSVERKIVDVGKSATFTVFISANQGDSVEIIVGTTKLKFTS